MIEAAQLATADEVLIRLGLDQATDTRSLVLPSRRVFGPQSTTPDLAFEAITIRIGRRPQAYHLRTLFQQNGRPLPPGREMYYSEDLWLVCHWLGVLKTGGFEKLDQVGFRVHFPPRPRVAVHDLLPQTQFVTRFRGSARAKAAVDLEGRLSVPGAELMGLLSGPTEALPLGGKIRLSSSLDVVGEVSLDVITPVVQAIGRGDFTSEWVFSRASRPLVGDQLMVQVVRVPQLLTRLKYEVQAYATVTGLSSLYLVPIRLESAWERLEVPLKVPAPV